LYMFVPPNNSPNIRVFIGFFSACWAVGVKAGFIREETMNGIAVETHDELIRIELGILFTAQMRQRN